MRLTRHFNYLMAMAVIPLAFVFSGCTQTFSTEVESAEKISDTSGNFNNNLSDGDQFGSAITNLGDIESDGVIDLAVGAPGDDDGGSNRGAVWVLFMDDDGQVDLRQKISTSAGNFSGALDDNDQFGRAVAGLDDLNLDGFSDLVVGAPGDDDGGPDRGAVWILNLNASGTVTGQQKIADGIGGFSAALDDGDGFGSSVASLGDLDNDGVTDIAVGAPNDDDGGTDRGAVWILFLNNNGSVKTRQKISFTQGGFAGNLENNDLFGSAITSVGDMNGDGVTDIAVGVPGDDDGGSNTGAIWLLFMNSNGTVGSEQKISQTEGEFDNLLVSGDQFGVALANLGDMNSDGINELAVGASFSDDGGIDRGAFWVLFLRRDGTVISSSKISNALGNFKGTLGDNDQFGKALVGLDDLDNDGVNDIASGALFDDDGGQDRGAVWVLFMSPVEVGVRVDRDADLATLFGGN